MMGAGTRMLTPFLKLGGRKMRRKWVMVILAFYPYYSNLLAPDGDGGSVSYTWGQ